MNVCPKCHEPQCCCPPAGDSNQHWNGCTCPQCAERIALRKRVEEWEADAKRYASNATYWQDRAEKAEQERDDWRAAATTHIETIGILSDQKIQLQADLDAALVLCVASDWDVEVLGAGYEPEVYKAHAHVLPLLEKRREGRG